MKYKYIIITMLLAIVSITSCKDDWDKHYSVGEGLKSDLNLYDYIKSQPDLSTFTQMLKISGYDSILTKSQTYTVWAPVNSGLTNVNLSDTSLVTDIVKNHIARFSYPTSGIESKTIYMAAKKFQYFKKTEMGYSFGNIGLLQLNISVANGILHTMSGYVSYTNNIWEFIGKTPGLDSIRAYLYAQSTSEFDKINSIEIGTDSLNRAIYDSVIIFSNPILDKIGQLQDEDSTFVAILPNNTAWKKIYAKIQSNYKTLAKDGGVVQQRLNTQYAIVNNLVFKFKDLNTDPTTFDSLTTTTGTTFLPSSYLFEGATKNILSNGLAYVTDSLRFKAADSWQKPIKIEAENSSYGRSFLYSSLSVHSSLGTNYRASLNKYLVSEPTNTSNKTPNSVTFPIPNTLSGKYRIYCVFMPASIVFPENVKANKVKFNFSYINSAGTPINNAAITSKNLISTAVGAIAGSFPTTPSEITKMFVTQIDFPFCNLYTTKSVAADITVKLKVENAVLNTETALFDTTLRIDYIILEPVQ